MDLADASLVLATLPVDQEYDPRRRARGAEFDKPEQVDELGENLRR